LDSIRFYLRDLTSLLLILLISTSCVHREAGRPVSTAYFLDAIARKTGLKKDFTAAGKFSLESESLNYAGNFFLIKNKNGIKLRVYGPFGIKAQEIKINSDEIQDTTFLYLLGYYPQIRGEVIKRGDTYYLRKNDKVTLKIDKRGNILLVSLKGVKIFLSNYKRFQNYEMPERIIVRKGMQILRINLLKVEYRP